MSRRHGAVATGPGLRARSRGGKFGRWKRAAGRTITFQGEYPLGTVDYADPRFPVSVIADGLLALHPAERRRLRPAGRPLRVHAGTTRAHAGDAEIGGWLQNACSLYSAAPAPAQTRVNTVRDSRDRRDARAASYRRPASADGARPTSSWTISARDYGDWKGEGNGVRQGARSRARMCRRYQGDWAASATRRQLPRLRARRDVGGEGRQTGTLTSPPFTIERKYLTFYIGGGEERRGGRAAR